MHKSIYILVTESQVSDKMHITMAKGLHTSETPIDIMKQIKETRA